MLLRARKPAKKLAYRKRCNALTSHQQVESRQIKKLLKILGMKRRLLIRVATLIKTRNDENELEELEQKESEIKKLDIAIKFYTIKYLRIMY